MSQWKIIVILILPSVSLRATPKSSSLVICLCKDPIGIVDIDEDEAFKFEGNNGLQGEWDPVAAALDDDDDDEAAAIGGIPDAVYKSWLNWIENKKLNVRKRSVYNFFLYTDWIDLWAGNFMRIFI